MFINRNSSFQWWKHWSHWSTLRSDYLSACTNTCVYTFMYVCIYSPIAVWNTELEKILRVIDQAHFSILTKFSLMFTHLLDNIWRNKSAQTYYRQKLPWNIWGRRIDSGKRMGRLWGGLRCPTPHCCLCRTCDCSAVSGSQSLGEHSDSAQASSTSEAWRSINIEWALHCFSGLFAVLKITLCCGTPQRADSLLWLWRFQEIIPEHALRTQCICTDAGDPALCLSLGRQVLCHWVLHRSQFQTFIYR